MADIYSPAQLAAFEAQDEADTLRKRVEALEAQRDEALKALPDVRPDRFTDQYVSADVIREARRILSGDGGSA